MKVVDVIGQRFERLLVLDRAGSSASGEAVWACRCDCGNNLQVRGKSLRRGHTRSCGCLASERSSVQLRRHGQCDSSEYRVWRGIKNRCLNPQVINYPLYGGRGITVCERWRTSFEAFFADMGLRPNLDYTIDRIDNDGNYEPGNCRWATRKQQGRNTRYNTRLSLHGETLTLSEWSERLGINRHTLSSRLRRGLTVGQVLHVGSLRPGAFLGGLL